MDNRTGFSRVRDLLVAGETVRVRVEGQSMLPFFRSGSVIRLRPLRDGDLKRGSVVMAQTPAGNFVVHRVLRLLSDGRVELLGDGNFAATEVVARDSIFGAVDCGFLHRLLARMWLWARPVRRYPLAILRRSMK